MELRDRDPLQPVFVSRCLPHVPRFAALKGVMLSLPPRHLPRDHFNPQDFQMSSSVVAPLQTCNVTGDDAGHGWQRCQSSNDVVPCRPGSFCPAGSTASAPGALPRRQLLPEPGGQRRLRSGKLLPVRRHRACQYSRGLRTSAWRRLASELRHRCCGLSIR